MRKYRWEPGRGSARPPLRWLRSLLAGAALSLVAAGYTPALAYGSAVSAVVPSPLARTVPAAPPVNVPPVTVANPPPVGVPNPPPVIAPSLPPVSVPAPPSGTVPPVTVLPPVSNPAPPIPPTTVSVPPLPPPPTVNLPPVPTPDPQLPVAAPPPPAPNNTAGVSLPGVQGTQGLPGASGASGVSAATAQGSGVAGISGAVDPAVVTTVDVAQARFALGERDYSSAGSSASFLFAAPAARASQGSLTASPADSVPMICPQIAFTPLVDGCKSVLGPLVSPLDQLAHTGSPIVLGLAGLLIMALGAVVYRRSSRTERDGRPRRLQGLGTR